MKRQPNKGKGLLITIIIFLLIVIGVLCYYTFVMQKPVKRDTASDISSSNTESAPPQSVPESAQTIKKLDDSKELVYTAYSAEGEDTGIANGYSFKLPAINLDTEDIKTLNAKILRDVMPDIEEQIETAEDDASTWMTPVDYEYYVNGPIISVVVSMHFPNDGVDWNIYNVNKDTGRILSNRELLALKNLDEKNFGQKLSEACAKDYVKTWGEADEFAASWGEAIGNELDESDVAADRISECYQEDYNMTIKENAYGAETLLFLGEKNTIEVVIYRYGLGLEGHSGVLDTGI